MLKEAVLKEMHEIGDDNMEVIYENSSINDKLSLESLIIIIKIASKFRVYQGYLHQSGSITVKSITIDENMLNSMIKS